jgi:hypothetical protein
MFSERTRFIGGCEPGVFTCSFSHWAKCLRVIASWMLVYMP